MFKTKALSAVCIAMLSTACAKNTPAPVAAEPVTAEPASPKAEPAPVAAEPASIEPGPIDCAGGEECPEGEMCLPNDEGVEECTAGPNVGTRGGDG